MQSSTESTGVYKSQANAAFEQRLNKGKCPTGLPDAKKSSHLARMAEFLTVQMQRHGNRATPLPKGGLCSSDDRDVSCCTTLPEFGFQIRQHLDGHTAARQGKGKKKSKGSIADPNFPGLLHNSVWSEYIFLASTANPTDLPENHTRR